PLARQVDGTEVRLASGAHDSADDDQLRRDGVGGEQARDEQRRARDESPAHRVRSYTAGVTLLPSAVVLLSGGLDSSPTLAIARRDFTCYALSFEYGQRHHAELEAARRVATALGAARHEVIAFDLRRFGGSALTADLAVPKDRAPGEIAHGIPVTYVPARNTIFLSFALAWAETLGA